MRYLKLFIFLPFVACTNDIVKKDGYDRFQTALSSGSDCGRLLKKLPTQDGTTWSESSRQSVEYAFTECLRSYSLTDSHASSLEFFKATFKEMQISFEEVGLANSSRLIAYFDKNPQKQSVLIVHSTDMTNSQMIAADGKANSMWGQQKNDVKSVGIMQLMAIAFAHRSKIPGTKNLVFLATVIGQNKEALKMFPSAQVVINEGGFGFNKQNKNVFLIGAEQKGGAWLKFKHKSATRLLSHLDQLMAVFLPHDPQDFKDPGKCQIKSFTTVDQTVNTIPYKVDMELRCKGLSEMTIGKAFVHQDVSIIGKKDGDKYSISLELSYPQENKLGKLSALQVAAQGLQKLSIIPYRDWSFEEPQFYKHVRTPASVSFVKTVKEVYPQQSAWGDLLWELDSSGEWSQVRQEITPDKRDGPEKMFRTTCHWTGFESNENSAEAYVDCRLVHTGFMKNINESHAQVFIKQLKARAKDKMLQIEMLRGWNYMASDTQSNYVKIMKEEISKEYPSAQTSTWLAPAGLILDGTEARRIPTYGFYPVIQDDFLDDKQEKGFPAQQIFTANKIYSGTIRRFTN
ncbi:hypothetical protein K2X05_10905 [bacterium]|nr:hypothetical protein [bacterium]